MGRMTLVKVLCYEELFLMTSSMLYNADMSEGCWQHLWFYEFVVRVEQHSNYCCEFDDQSVVITLPMCSQCIPETLIV